MCGCMDTVVDRIGFAIREGRRYENGGMAWYVHLQGQGETGLCSIVKKIIYQTSDEGHEAVCIHIHIWSSPITLEGLMPGIVPIFPRLVSFNCKSQQGTRIKISWTQLPLLPAWAFTDYKVQGASLNTVIMDLTSAQGMQHAYIMLS